VSVPLRAVVLVGGEGTRLRPLTATVPKPLVDFLDRPFLDVVLDHLAAHGVTEAILSSPYLEETFAPFLASRAGAAPALTWITETEPLGTAGAIANARDRLDGPTFVLNGDILTDLDLTALMERHRDTGAVATITLTHVDDARPYGLVTTEGTRVLEFREKPSEPVPGEVNAGTYVLEPRALDGVPPGRSVSIEREVFPALIAAGHVVSAFPSDAYWLDLGTPERYLQAHADALEGRIGGFDVAAPFIGEGAQVDPTATLGRHAVVGPGARIDAGAEVHDSIVQRGASVGARARVRDSILGPGSRVGDGALVRGSVLGEGAEIERNASADGARVDPGTRFGVESIRPAASPD
jgi:mannose-1-phosphate guanylyltransferase